MLQVNATLTAVTGATKSSGGIDDWDAPATPGAPGVGTPKWTGSADAYYREGERRVVTSTGVTVVPVRELVVDTSVARASGVDTDDVLTFTDPAGVVRKSTAEAVALRELAGFEAVSSARITLRL